MNIFYRLGYVISRVKSEYQAGYAAGSFSTPRKNTLEQEILNVLRSGNGTSKYVAAIKRYRELTNSMLREAKDGVDDIMLRHGIPK